MSSDKGYSAVKVALLLGACFLIESTVLAMYLGAPQIALDLGIHKAGLGILGGVGSASYVLTCLWTGRLSDRRGRKALPVVGTAVIATGFMCMPLARNLAQLCLCRAVTGLGHGMFWPCIEAWLGDESPAGDVLRTVGRFNLSWATVDIFAPVLWGRLYDFRPALLFHAGAAVALVPFLMLLPLPAARREKVLQGDALLPPHPRWQTFLIAAWVANFFSYLCNGLITALFPELARTFGYYGQGAGTFLALAYITRLAAFIIAPRTAFWLYKARLQVGWQWAAIAGLLLIGLGNSGLVFGLACALIGVSMGMSYSASMFYSLAAPQARGSRSAAHEIFVGLGMAVGPIFGGWLAQVFDSLRAPYYFGAAAVLFGIAVQCVLFLVGRRSRP